MGIVREILTEMGPGEEAGFHLSRDLKMLRGWGTPKIVSAPICTPLLWNPLRINPLSSQSVSLGRTAAGACGGTVSRVQTSVGLMLLLMVRSEDGSNARGGDLRVERGLRWLGWVREPCHRVDVRTRTGYCSP